jgi:transcriptional regulator with XRE-family HTH domain
MSLERERVCEALKRLRLIRPEFRQKSKFMEASGLYAGTIHETEAGRILPGVETIEKWVRACGITLTEFFASLEESKTPSMPKIAPEHQRPIQLLIDILERGDEETADWFISSLEIFHRRLLPQRRIRRLPVDRRSNSSKSHR